MYAPHILLLCAAPGDEIVGASAAIVRAREQGSRVSVLMMTHGLPPAAPWSLWQKHRQPKRLEKIAAASQRIAQMLGFQYAGWSMSQGLDSLWQRLPQVASQIARTIEALQPQCLWVPAFMGLSPDQDAINIAASRLRGLIDIYEYVARPEQLDTRRFHVHFPSKNGMELALNPSISEATKRRRAIEILQAAGTQFVFAETDRELFRPLPVHDYARPPFGYIAGPTTNPTRQVKARAAALLKRVRPLFIAFLRKPPITATSAPTSQPSESR
ncbi:MAG: PIG-L family deacetylase [Bdellovibrionales bacterium]